MFAFQRGREEEELRPIVVVLIRTFNKLCCTSYVRVFSGNSKVVEWEGVKEFVFFLSNLRVVGVFTF